MFIAAPDSTYYAVHVLELARGSYYEQHVSEPVEPILGFLQEPQQAAETTDLKRNEPFGNFSTVAFDRGQFVTTAKIGANTVILAPRDPWLVATWALIADHRNLAPGWDGASAVAPTRERLDSAEALATLISAKPMRARPQFSVDSDGRPSFALYDDRLYLHLTIDAADRLSWYAVSGGVESFEDDIVFDGTQLPPQLDQLL